MRILSRFAVSLLAAAFLLPFGLVSSAQNVAKKKVTSTDDLPRFSYPVSSPPSVMLMADDAAFNAFAQKVVHDIDSVLNDYDIQDKATLRSLYEAKLDFEMLTNDNEAALSAMKTLKELQEKPEAKAASGMLDRPLVEARIASRAATGEAFERAFRTNFESSVNSLEWRMVQDRVKSIKRSFELATPNLVVGSEKQGLDPAAAKSNTVDLPGAETMIEDRAYIKVIFPVKDQVLPVLTAYIAAHNVRKPDIWAARDVTLSSDQKLTPVRIGIWDSGVDTSLFPAQLFIDPAPGTHSPHGLAFDVHGSIFNADLQPLSSEQKELYPKIIGLEQGMDDMFNSIDSPAADDAKKMLSSMPPEKLAPFLKEFGFLGQYMHGTHVAGIAVRGNPAARLVVVQFYDSLPEISFPPTVEWATKFKVAFQQVGQYFRDNNVRVVNMSWADDVAEFEQWLTKTTTEKDPAARKQLAQSIFKVWREAVEGAIESAPNTLFICAAGNSDSNTGFNESVPASLHLPNLMAVGAVDQAGEETSFTSYGDTVVVDANGYQVESYVPGGTMLKFSGTSMASPNVVNLAAKLFALDPSLTPEQTINLIKRGADRSEDGRRNLINPKATIALLKTQTASK